MAMRGLPHLFSETRRSKPCTFSARLSVISAKICMIIAKDERKSKSFAYDESFDRAYRLGNKISLPRSTRRHQIAMSGLAGSNLWCRGCANLERCRFKRPRSYAHRIRSKDGAGRFGKTSERTFIKTDSTGISASAKTILGTTLLGDRLRRLEYGQYHGRSRAGIPGASSASVKQG